MHKTNINTLHQHDFWWAFSLASLLFLGLFYYANACGLWLTNDAKFYLAAAQNLREHGRLVDMHGDPLLLWPPLYPALLALAPGDRLVIFAYVHALAMLVSFFFLLKLGRPQISGRLAWYLYALALGTATPLLYQASFVWSEPIFLMLASMYVYWVGRFLHTQKAAFLWLAMLVGFLLPLQRVAGVFLLFGLWVGIGLHFRTILSQHLRKALLHVAVVGSGFLTWFGVVQFSFGAREAKAVDGPLALWHNMAETAADHLYIMARWLVPAQAGPLFWAAQFSVVPLSVYIYWKSDPKVRLYLFTAWAYILCYIITPALTQYGGFLEVERFLAMVYPFLLLPALHVADKHLAQVPAKARKLVAAGLLLLLIYPSWRTIKNAALYGDRSCDATARKALMEQVPRRTVGQAECFDPYKTRAMSSAMFR